jgi:hypothetical protein
MNRKWVGRLAANPWCSSIGFAICRWLPKGLLLPTVLFNGIWRFQAVR